MHICKKYPPLLGGDAMVVTHLQKQQEAAGHEVVVVTSRGAGARQGARLITVGLRDTSAGLDEITLRRIVSLLMLMVVSFAIFKRERPDVIHCHSIDMTWAVSWAARLFRIPLVHTFHIVTFYNAAQPGLRRRSEVWLAKKARPLIITAPNAYDVEQLRGAGLHQTVLLPNGVDIDFWQGAARRKPSARASDRFCFVAAGRLERQKGFAHLIRAAALLKNDAPPRSFEICIAGEGSQAGLLRHLAHSLGAEDAITFVGRKETAEIRDMLAAADAVVIPSLYETTPLTLLEAWSAGVPVVATAVGILRDESVDSAAVQLVPVRDDQALAEAMRTVMTTKTLRSSLAANGWQAVRQYSWPKVGQRAEQLYRSVA